MSHPRPAPGRTRRIVKTEMRQAIEAVVHALEIAGVVVVIGGLVLALARSARAKSDRFRVVRQSFGKAILLALELFVAADILLTVTKRPTVEDLTALAGIILIRTFLSFTLQIELEGRLPWRRAASNAEA